MIRILADQNLYKLSEFLPPQIDLVTYDPNIELPDLDGYDALLIRSVTKINNGILDKIPSSLKFIGTGSSGIDHVEAEEVQNRGIHFVDAKGSNANVVAEYVITALIILSEKNERILSSKIGIIGVGAVGSRVHELLLKLGHETVLYDPPREDREPGFTSSTIEDVLSCDVLTFHIPLEKNGELSTFHWLDETKLANRNYLAIINAARGGVIDEQAVLAAKMDGRIDSLVIDVWENEPDLNPSFLRHCDFATPHIAGSSIQSKKNASRMLGKELSNYFHLEMPKEELSPKEEVLIQNELFTLPVLLSRIHPLLQYDAKLRATISNENKQILFKQLRTDFPFRNEYSALRIPNLNFHKYPILEKLGIEN